MSDKKTGGAAPLLWEPPVLVIEGKEYPLRKLGLVDIERLTGIVRKVSQSVDALGMVSFDEMTPQKGMEFLISFMPHAMDEVIRFLAGVIGLKPGIPFEDAETKLAKSKAENPQDPNKGTIRDPDIFPLGSEVQLIGLLAEHRNVVDFFTNSKTLFGTLKTLLGRSSEPSTESKADTDGATDTSPEDT
ncbi:unnamed protein product [marine sediment metagenome]|uniref:Uncharacterized protein n=1 Tax=marine sediment metagenome TaxID=412755 RepID=X0T9K1_9ZZZZ